MSLEVRDLDFWLREANRRRLIRRSEIYDAAILPNLKSDEIQRKIDNLNLDIYGTEHEDEIEEAEQKAQKRLGEIKEKIRDKKIQLRKMREKKK